MKTLLVDGNWNLKKNFFKRKQYISNNGDFCGGVFGFIDSLRNAMERTLPDRVVVLWDGFNAGKMRYEIYKPYKSNRKKDWEREEKMIYSEGATGDYKDSEEFELLKQKFKTQNYLEELFVRQVEVDYIEADDLIASYILMSQIKDEEIIIYSRDKDFHQLVSDNVSVLTPDSFEIINKKNFKEKFGFIPENSLIIKCFEGDTSDKISGVEGVTRNLLLKHFPRMADEVYKYDRMVEEAYEMKAKKKLMFYDKIINARSILYRNAKLMNLRSPFVNEEAKEKINQIIYGYMDDKRSVQSAISSFIRDGFTKFIKTQNIDLFFMTYYRLFNKEKQYKETKLNKN